METLPDTIEECHQVIKMLSNALDQLSKRLEKVESENRDLKERLDNNSNNSSLPPSKDLKKKKKKNNRKSSGKKSGGQPGHKGHFRELLPSDMVDTITRCSLPPACSCGGNIKSKNEFMRHQVHELPELKLHVAEYQLQKGSCTCCRKKHIACLPEGVSWGLTGPRLTALMTNLVTQYRLSRRELKGLLQTYFDFKISLGTVFNKEKLVNEAMSFPVSELLPTIKESHAVHADETGHKRDGKSQWIWGFMSSTAAHFTIHASRGKKALRSLFGDFKNILISDRYSAYNIFESNQRQICWAHLKRDFTKLSEKENKVVARIGKNLLKNQSELFELWHQYKAGKQSRYWLQQKTEPIRRRIGELLEQGSYTDPSLRTARFCKNLLKDFNALWTFLGTEDVEPTNNHAERSLRPLVIWRKNYFCTRSDYGSEFVARSASINVTCKLQEKNIFEYTCQMMQNHFSGKPAPSLIFMT